MSIIHRYIAKNVFVATLFVLFMVSTLIFIISLLEELRDTGIGEYGFMQAVVHVMLLLPHTLYQFFPMLVLLGGVLGLGILAASQELMVIRTAGVSAHSMVGAVSSAVIVLIIVATLIGEVVAPTGDYLADQRKAAQQGNGQAVATSTGVWIHEGNNFLHIERVIDRHHLQGVTRYEFDDHHQLLAASYATLLSLRGGQWWLHDMVTTTLGNDRAHTQHFSSGTWNLVLDERLLEIGLTEPEQMSLPKLYNYMNYLARNGLQAGKYQFGFWSRLFQPLTALAMILLAIPFVFTAPRSVTLGKRILFAVIMGFVFYIFNALIGQLSIVFQISPLLAALVPTILISMIGYGLMMQLV